MAFGEDSWALVKDLKCLKCLGPMEVVIEKKRMIMRYAKCEEHDCQLKPEQYTEIRLKALEKIGLEEER